jgi:hypothetical protein
MEHAVSKMPPNVEPLRRQNFFISPQIMERLRVLAASQGTPVAEHVRRALYEYLTRQTVATRLKPPVPTLPQTVTEEVEQ